jgi:tetratricopeptide (TPR) repeat protein
MKITKIFALVPGTLISATLIQARVLIIVATPGHMRAAMNLVSEAQELLKKGDVASAKQKLDTVLQRDPTFWPALYVRAQIYSSQGKYDLALTDCNEALRHDRSVVEAALLRANINARLGKYAEAVKEYDFLVSLHPRKVTLARILADRAWFRATCPGCVISQWTPSSERRKGRVQHYDMEGEQMIDTLAAAYAETGDFNSAVQYAWQALAMKGIPSNSTKLFQQHLALFQQRKPIRL